MTSPFSCDKILAKEKKMKYINFALCRYNTYFDDCSKIYKIKDNFLHAVFQEDDFIDNGICPTKDPSRPTDVLFVKRDGSYFMAKNITFCKYFHDGYCEITRIGHKAGEELLTPNGVIVPASFKEVIATVYEDPNEVYYLPPKTLYKADGIYPDINLIMSIIGVAQQKLKEDVYDFKKSLPNEIKPEDFLMMTLYCAQFYTQIDKTIDNVAEGIRLATGITVKEATERFAKECSERG